LELLEAAGVEMALLQTERSARRSTVRAL